MGNHVLLDTVMKAPDDLWVQALSMVLLNSTRPRLSDTQVLDSRSAGAFVRRWMDEKRGPLPFRVMKRQPVPFRTILLGMLDPRFKNPDAKPRQPIYLSSATPRERERLAHAFRSPAPQRRPEDYARAVPWHFAVADALDEAEEKGILATESWPKGMTPDSYPTRVFHEVLTYPTMRGSGPRRFPRPTPPVFRRSRAFRAFHGRLQREYVARGGKVHDVTRTDFVRWYQDGAKEFDPADADWRSLPSEVNAFIHMPYVRSLPEHTRMPVLGSRPGVGQARAMPTDERRVREPPPFPALTMDLAIAVNADTGFQLSLKAIESTEDPGMRMDLIADHVDTLAGLIADKVPRHKRDELGMTTRKVALRAYDFAASRLTIPAASLTFLLHASPQTPWLWAAEGVLWGLQQGTKVKVRQRLAAALERHNVVIMPSRDFGAYLERCRAELESNILRA